MIRYVFYALIIILFLAGCTNVEKKEINSNVEVKTAKVALQVLENKVQAIAEVKPEKEVLLSSQFDGRIALLNVLPGDEVKKGVLIAKIKTKEADAISSTLKSEFSDISVVSPISGSVIKKYVSEGDVVNQGKPIVKIVARKPLYLLIDIPEEYFEEIKAGNEVKFVIGAKIYTGKVTAKSTAVDPLTGTFKVRASITGKGLLPGTFGKVWIITERKTCLAVPRKAVLNKNGGKVVFLVEGSYAKMRRVKTGLVTDKFVEIQKGLTQGEMVVTLGSYELEDGMRIVLKQKVKKELEPGQKGGSHTWGKGRWQ
jgi:multidrug efflux pump subunit AcrA (membrane-fusion protein)